MSHQYLRQLGEPDELMRHAVLNNTNLKVVFRLQNPAEAAELAEAVVAIDYERPLAASIKPTVIGHKRTELHSSNTGEQSSTSQAVGRARGEAFGESYSSSSSTSVSEGGPLALRQQREKFLAGNIGGDKYWHGSELWRFACQHEFQRHWGQHRGGDDADR